MDDYLSKLNPQQRAAVEFTDGPSLVIAGAGSGKTRVLTYKIVHLLQLGYEPYRILALTFTNKAAREMKERIAPLVGEDVAAQLWMGTFHSIFSKILRINAGALGYPHDYTIYDSADSKSLIKTIVKSMQLDDKTYKPATIQSRISKMKNALISPDDYELDRRLTDEDRRAKMPEFVRIYRAYWNRCRVSGAMDFDDLLFNTNILLRDNPDVLNRYQEFFRYVLVDEYQDTNFAQHLIVSQITKKNNKICVVGDDAQSIYSFRGANIRNILNLENYYPGLKTFKLEQNYRSTKNIIEAANSLIEKNKEQIRKHIFSENGQGARIPVIQCYSDYEEGYAVASKIVSLKSNCGDSYDDFAVLYRTNAQSRVLEEALRKRNIPYRIYGGLSFYQRKEIKDAVAYFRMAINPNDDEALRRIINYPARGIGDKTLEKLQACAVKCGVSMWEVLSDMKKHELDINSGTAKKLDGFKLLIDSMVTLNQTKENDAFAVASTIVEKSGLMRLVSCDDTPENISRKENLEELVNGVSEFVSNRESEGNENVGLVDFLGEISLATDQDSDNGESGGACVTLMTVHAAKGLEFNNVIVVGVEEDLFPSAMSSDSIQGIEEERRLLYVAITRAKNNCVLSYATSRFHNGQTKSCTISRFIKDINPSYLNLSQTSSMGRGATKSFGGFNSGIESRNYSYPSHQSPEAPSGFVPMSKSRPTIERRAPAPSSAAVGGEVFAIHTASELSVGTVIRHIRFGEGTITSIDETGADAKIVVAFNNLGEKIILLRFAKFQIVK